MNRCIFTVPKNCLQQVKDKYPFIFLEHGRIEVNDRSIKFIESDGTVVSIPCGVINCILLGPGTTITHDAVKILAEFNCNIFWVGEFGLKFYSSGITPSLTSKNFTRQMEYACSKSKSLEIVKKMFKLRFPDIDLSDKSLQQMRGIEGSMLKKKYQEYAKKYKVIWKFRDANLTEWADQDDTNKYLTAFNMYLYAVICSAVLSLGFSPYIGFVHRNSPLPFIYDIADLYKDEMSIEPSFALTDVVDFDKEISMTKFIENAQKFRLLDRVSKDLIYLFDVKEEPSEKTIVE